MFDVEPYSCRHGAEWGMSFLCFPSSPEQRDEGGEGRKDEQEEGGWPMPGPLLSGAAEMCSGVGAITAAPPRPRQAPRSSEGQPPWDQMRTCLLRPLTGLAEASKSHQRARGFPVLWVMDWSPQCSEWFLPVLLQGLVSPWFILEHKRREGLAGAGKET